MNTPSLPDGVVSGNRHLYAVRVYYEDTDLSGIVYHANYLRWFERARSDLLRILRIDQRSAIEEGEGAYAVSEMEIKYLRPAKLDDDLTIETSCLQANAASCRMYQRALRGPEVLCEARLRIGFIKPDGRPRRQPLGWRETFNQFMEDRLT